MCGAKSPTFSQPRIEPHRETPLLVFNVCLVSIQIFFVRKYELFQHINCALLEVSVKDHIYSSPRIDTNERLHASITCDVWMHEMDLFFITKTRSPQAVVKEEFELSPWNNWPLSGTSRGQTKKWQKAEEKGSRALPREAEWRLERCQRKVSDCAPDPLHTAASASVWLIGIQSREGSMGVSVTRTGGAAVCLQQCSTFAAGWELTGEPASETDTLSLVKWTVTLHFSTAWQHRIGRFEPCDVTLIEFCPLLPPAVLRKKAG